ncbi:MAG: T9SS type A sorting domain-containing protein [Bacteroidia bacterium]
MNLFGGGSSSICDNNGILQFYTDGITVWNKNNSPMPNGNGLMGHFATTQSSLIVKQPENDSIYYIFTADYRYSFPNNRGFRYSIVNMSLQGGLGDVVQKNIPLLVPATQQQTAIKHCNNRDFWIVAHEYDTTAFYSYLLSDTGLSAPIISYAGLGNIQSNIDGAYIKASPYGNKLVQIIGNGSTLTTQIFNFNRNTGQISLYRKFAEGAQDAEFSPDGEKLYLTIEVPNGNGDTFGIWQYNLLAGTDSQIVNSRILVGMVAGTCQALQIASNGKIYTARSNKDSLGVINYPNLLGISCNYIDNGVSLSNKLCLSGLPNLYHLYPSIPIINSFTYSDTLYGDTTFFTIPQTTYIDSVRWNFDDNVTGAENTSALFQPYHIFSSDGVYTVQTIIYYPCNTDTIYKIISIEKPLGIANKEVSAIHIYPNPFTGKVFIKNISNETVQIEICDIMGRAIVSQLPIKENENVALDISDQPAGLYLLKTLASGTVRAHKLLKQ